MNKLQKAYSILGLEPGSSKETIQTRFRRLIMVWHPDRFTSDEDKKNAEEELKKINNAKDLLFQHFNGGTHKASGCECQQPSAEGSPHSSKGPGPGRSRTAADDEAEAQRRDDERKRRAAAEESARKQQQQQQTQSTQQQYTNAEKQEAALNENKLRWKIALAEVALFVGLSLFGWAGNGVKDWWHDFSWHWQQDHPSHSDTSTNTSTSTGTTTVTDVIATPKIDIPPVVKVDPCLQTSPSTTPPDIILPNTHNWVRQAVTQWTVKCQGNNEGATVAGRDEKARLLDWQEYGPNWVFVQQWTFKYGWAGSGEEISVDLYKPQFDFIGRAIYSYDRDHNLLEVRQVDSHQCPIVTGTIQRRPGGGFYQTILKSFDSSGSISNTRLLYQPDDPQMASSFYQFGMFGTIPKTVEQAPNLASPDLPLSTTPGTDSLMDKLNKLNASPEHRGFFSQNKPLFDTLPGSGLGVPYGTATSTSTSIDDYLYKSPSSSLTPSTPNKLYTSPFTPAAPPPDTPTLFPSPSPSSLSNLMKRYGLDSGTKLIDPDIMKKYELRQGTLGAPTPSSSKIDELMRKYELDKAPSTSVQKN